MIDKKKLGDMILKNEVWGRITSPDELQIDISPEEKRHPDFWEWLFERKMRFAAAAGMLAAIAISIILFNPKGETLEISCPYNGETRVDLIGSFNRWDRKIAMHLDTSAGLWKAKVSVPRKGIYEYQFIIDELIYSAGNSPYKIKGPNGEEKAVVIISYVTGNDGNGFRYN